MSRLLNNWNLKVVALVMAIALWGHVRGEINPLETATFIVPLQATAPPDMRIVNQATVPREVRVTIRAPRVVLRDLKGGMSLNPLASPTDALPLSSRYVRAVFDFSGAKVGTASVAIKVDSLVNDAEVLGAKPTDAMITLAAR